MMNHDSQEERIAERSDKNRRHILCYGHIMMYIVNTGFVKQVTVFLISNFCHVLNYVFFLLGDSLVSEFYVPVFHNTLPVVLIVCVSRKNNQVEIVGVFIHEKVQLKNSPSQSEGGGTGRGVSE
jgi:hypothetical protein